MYGDDNQEAAQDLEDRYAQHNRESAEYGGAGANGSPGKKKKKGRKRPKVNIEPSASASI